MTKGLRFTPDISSRLVFLALFSVPLVITSIQEFQGKGHVANVLVSTILLIIPQLWFAGQKILIQGKTLLYQKWFFIKQQISLDKVVKAMLCAGLQRQGHGYFRFEIYDNGNFSQTPLIINIKPFQKSMVKIVAAEIFRFSPEAELDKTLQKTIGDSRTATTNFGLRNLWIGGCALLVIVVLLTIIRRLFL